MASQQPGAAPARKSGGMLHSPVTWIVVLVLALGGGAYLLYRRSQAASSSSSGTSTDTSATAAGTANPDWSGEIATLQEEIMDLQSTEAQDEDEDEDHKGGGGKKKTARKVRVPGVIGQSQESAFSELQGAGLKGESPDKPVKGRTLTVTSQDPKPGTMVDRGSVVHLRSKLVAPNWPPGKKKTGGGGQRGTIRGGGGSVNVSGKPGRKAPAHHVTRKAA